MDSSPAGQLLLVGVPGPELDAATAAILRRVQPGGFILFTRNLVSPAQTRRLLDDLRDLSRVEPILTIDQEGGRVSRLKAIGTEPPGATQLRERNDPDLVRRHGELTARLLRLFGFNLDLAPVLDLCLDGNEEADNSLRGRCYGTDVPQVLRLAGAFSDALRAGGILNCGKHFPGYTAAGSDAHHELPVIDRSRAELDATELAPFRDFIARGALDSTMVCHAHYPQLDTEHQPASLSANVIRGLLREELGFRGLVMTDDLDMGAIYHRYGLEDALRRALLAGNDLAMICHRVEALGSARDFLAAQPAALLDRALAAVADFKQKLAPPAPVFSEAAFRAIDAEIWDLRVATLGAEAAAQRSPEDGKRSPVEIY
ncbi:MAG: glycoside hydrolase family 3 protein [Verrucomicrobia bacterium]|nr:glycoside hydrolase family 3 protein [Verrucomicrobiota bacterium]